MHFDCMHDYDHRGFKSWNPHRDLMSKSGFNPYTAQQQPDFPQPHHTRRALCKLKAHTTTASLASENTRQKLPGKSKS